MHIYINLSWFRLLVTSYFGGFFFLFFPVPAGCLYLHHSYILSLVLKTEWGKTSNKGNKSFTLSACEILWSISLYLNTLSKSMNIIIWIRRFYLWDSSLKWDHINNRVQTGFGLCLPLYSLAAEGFFPRGEFGQNRNLATHLASHLKHSPSL